MRYVARSAAAEAEEVTPKRVMLQHLLCQHGETIEAAPRTEMRKLHSLQPPVIYFKFTVPTNDRHNNEFLISSVLKNETTV
jgi:hypothetical protein